MTMGEDVGRGTAQSVLLLEDQDDVAAYLEDLIETFAPEAFRIERVASLSNAFERLENDTFDVAICDLNVSDSKGIDTANALLTVAPDLPMIVLTGLDRAVGLEAMRAGAQDFIQKSDCRGSRLTDAMAFAIERKRNELELADEARRSAFVDSLTDLPRREALDDAWPQIAARTIRSGKGVALLVADLDDLKLINDTWGHPTGDMVLKELARRLKRGVRASDLVFRFGGDEFVVILEEIETRHDLDQVLTSLEVQLGYPIHTAAHHFRVGVSVGSVLVRASELRRYSLQDIFERADTAMYENKAERKSAAAIASSDSKGLRDDAIPFASDDHLAAAG